jgi:hypothetical protein
VGNKTILNPHSDPTAGLSRLKKGGSANFPFSRFCFEVRYLNYLFEQLPNLESRDNDTLDRLLPWAENLQ